MNEEIRWLWEHSGMKGQELARVDPDAPARARKYGFLRIAQTPKNAHTLAIGAGKHWSIGPCPVCLSLTENDKMDRYATMCAMCARSADDYDPYTPEGKARWGAMGKEERIRHLLEHEGKSMGLIYDTFVGYLSYDGFTKWLLRNGFRRDHARKYWEKIPCASCGQGSDPKEMGRERLCGSCKLASSSSETVDRPLTLEEEKEASRRRLAIDPNRGIDKRHPIARRYSNLRKWMPPR